MSETGFPKIENNGLKEADKESEVAQELLHQELSRYLRQEMFRARRDLPDGGSLFFRANFFYRLINLVDALEDIEQKIIREDAKEQPDFHHLTSQIPQEFGGGLTKLIEDYEKNRAKVQKFIETYPAEAVFEVLTGESPKGNIREERIFDAIGWYFENDEDRPTFYKKRPFGAYSENQAREVSGEVMPCEVFGQEIRIVSFPARPAKSTQTHERRHVIFSHTSPLDYQTDKKEPQTEGELFEAIQAEWQENLRDELIAYLREYLKHERFLFIEHLADFGETALYNYPEKNKENIQGVYNKLFDTNENFEAQYEVETQKYQLFVKKLVNKVDSVFYEIGDYRRTKDKNRIRGLRILELYPLSSWPKAIDRLEQFLNEDFTNKMFDWVAKLRREMEYDVAPEFDINDMDVDKLLEEMGKAGLEESAQEEIRDLAKSYEYQKDELYDAENDIGADVYAAQDKHDNEDGPSAISLALDVITALHNVSQKLSDAKKEITPILEKLAELKHQIAKKLRMAAESLG